MRTIRELGEGPLIARLRRRLGPAGRGGQVLIGIGDDAAVLRSPAGQRWLFASDMLVEGVHFRRGRVSAQRIGWKALAANISDIAAMGGTPQWAVVSLGLPPTTAVSFVEALYDGLKRCARRYGVTVVGGDTVRAPQLVVDVAILGSVGSGQLVLRSGARPGDVLFVTGRLGGSLGSGRHASFIPRMREAQQLARRVRVRAMMDLSDGLASDLWQVSRASRCTLRVQAARIPVSRAARTCRQRSCRCRRWAGGSAVFHAVMDGEDFELLFAVAPRDVRRLPARLGSCPVTRIGRVVGGGVRVELEHPDGRISRLSPQGFRHF